jgi:hypothetical protein
MDVRRIEQIAAAPPHRNFGRRVRIALNAAGMTGVRAMERLPDGQITFVPDVAMSSPLHKNISLNPSGKSSL